MTGKDTQAWTKTDANRPRQPETVKDRQRAESEIAGFHLRQVPTLCLHDNSISPLDSLTLLNLVAAAREDRERKRGKEGVGREVEVEVGRGGGGIGGDRGGRE